MCSRLTLTLVNPTFLEPQQPRSEWLVSPPRRLFQVVPSLQWGCARAGSRGRQVGGRRRYPLTQASLSLVRRVPTYASGANVVLCVGLPS